ncbi:uncharacterized protein DUF4293 [Ulvibacter sp. MAR_2010_11]|uniref:DUF4293 domain-containing protein n=1 Tax=Ulvibacter sp. MAR_2010_11 TaxID=1250229 RepID=UPI000C2C1C66|nr:DUF4293 domain-containing protein [Ulvibacter sp. MAR_2010_11]PKA82239.1 uncharacterized protein DUF4293 [Ulvibacter sp. MAR_2010_11]
MLQRIQTVYLILSILLMGGLYLWFPTLRDASGVAVLLPSDPLAFLLIFGAMGLIIISILSYKKRQLQFVLNRLSIILIFVLLGVFVYKSLNVSGETLVSEKGIGVLFPVISIVFLVLANKAIKRDEDLVKSVDRLR